VSHGDGRRCLEARWTAWTARRSVECVEDGGCTASHISVLSPLSFLLFSGLNHNIFFFFFLGFGWYLTESYWGKFETVENWKANFAFVPFSLVKCEFFWLAFQWFYICRVGEDLIAVSCLPIFFFSPKTLSAAYCVAVIFFYYYYFFKIQVHELQHWGLRIIFFFKEKKIVVFE